METIKGIFGLSKTFVTFINKSIASKMMSREFQIISDKSSHVCGLFSCINAGGYGVFVMELGLSPEIWVMGRDCEQDYLDFRRRLLAEGRAALLGEFNDYGWYLSHVVKLSSRFFR
jgi:hypothetical protein